MNKTTCELSIVILSFNTKDLTLQAIQSIEDNYPEEVSTGAYELIVADNASTDGSLAAFTEYKKHTKITSFHAVDNGGNFGFSKGNNNGVSLAQGRFVLFLNPDTIVYKKTLSYLLSFMNNHPIAGAVTCKLINKDGDVDFNCHRGFPTPWNAFCYFSGLQKAFPHSRLFAGYTQGWKDLDTTHAVDAIEGAFMMMPTSLGEKIGWWDEDYFFYGEDLQFCFDIKKAGYKIYYVGKVESLHIGGASSGIKKTKEVVTSSPESRRKVQTARFEAMKIFYKKNYRNTYPSFIHWVVNTGISYLEKRAIARVSK